MSLSSSIVGGGGAGSTGLVLAHGGPSGQTIAQHACPPTSSGTNQSTQGPPSSFFAPPNLSVLGADVIDKNQRGLGLRSIRNVANMPLVAVDLYGDQGCVAYYPPLTVAGNTKEAYSGCNEVDVEVNDTKKKMKITSTKEHRSVIMVKSVGELSNTSLVLNGESDASYRALRRLLTKGRGYNAVFLHALSSSCSSSSSNGWIKGKEADTSQKEESNGDIRDQKTVTLHKPHLLLGARNTNHLHDTTLSLYDNVSRTEVDYPSEYAEDPTFFPSHYGIGVCIRNGTLDGHSSPRGDDFDRVSLQLRLRSNKKGLTVLPEEAVGILLTKARAMVYKLMEHRTNNKDINSNDRNANNADKEVYVNYPPALSVPAWACRDSAMEALLDATSNNATTLYQRSVAALAGALMARSTHTGVSPQTDEMYHANMNGSKLFMCLMSKIQNLKTKGKKNVDDEISQISVHMPLVIMAGLTEDGVELTGVRVGVANNQGPLHAFAHCPFGEFDVIASVSYRHSDPLSIVQECVVELSHTVGEKYPELEEDGGIAAIITYGSITKQLKMKDEVTKALRSMDNDIIWNDNKVAFMSTREECVVYGTAILAATSHGRIVMPLSPSSKKNRAALTIKNVVSVAVGVKVSFSGEKKGTKWSDIKTVFDYDRRVTTRPYQLDFTAAECVAMRNDLTLWNNPERLVEEAKKWSASKDNLVRADAALDFCVQVLQQLEKGGKWIPVGNAFRPLTITELSNNKNGNDVSYESQDNVWDEQEKKDNTQRKRIPIESAVLELNQDPMGLITNALVREGRSIDQALKAARSSIFYHYLRITLAVLFFGGFFIKSFVEDANAKRDVERILVYYKHVLPGSFSDGDKRNSRYLVWKYRGKMEKLWKRLETKYGVPVHQLHEWEDYGIDLERNTQFMREEDGKSNNYNEEDDSNINNEEDENEMNHEL